MNVIERMESINADKRIADFRQMSLFDLERI